ncbi:MAG: hypothetical protein JWO86_1099 [Myxococcaceae bacterium]|nr:hypothetical protein [Myxococcaceae bacterium]
MLSRRRATLSLSLSLDDSRIALLPFARETKSALSASCVVFTRFSRFACLIEDADLRLSFMQIDANIFHGWSSLFAALAAFLVEHCYHVV